MNSARRTPVAGIVVIALLAIHAPASAVDTRVITVSKDGSGDYATIQQAIDMAGANDVIRVAAGTWRESVTITKPLTLEGSGWQHTRLVAASKTQASPELVEAIQRILQELDSEKTRNEVLAAFQRAYGTSPTLTVHSTSQVRVRNMAVLRHEPVREGRFRSAAAIEIRDAEAEVAHCAVLESPGQGLAVSGDSRLAVRDCLIANAWGQGILVSVTSRGSVEIADSDIRNCVYSGISMGRVGQNTTVTNCRIHGTGWHGIRYDSSSPKIERNLIYDTAVSGIYASGQTSATVRNNLFYLSGISCWFQNADTIEHNTFLGDRDSESAAGLSTGISVLGASTPQIRRNLFVDCEQAVSLGDIGSDSPFAKSTGAVNLSENVFWNNQRALVQREASDQGSIVKELPLPEGNERRQPEFADPENRRYSLKADSALRLEGIGAEGFAAFATHWPIQPEEKRAIEAVKKRKAQTVSQR